MAANLQNINKTNEQLVKGLDKVQTNLDKIGTRGFKNLNREANQTLKTVQKLSLGLAKLYRPGRAVERRGVLLGGLGAAGGLGMLSSTGAGKAIGGAMGAGSAKAAGFMSMIPGLKGAGAALTATTAKIAGVSKGLAGLGALMAAQPQLLGVAMAAWLAFGNKGLFNAAKQAEKTTVKLFGLEKALSNAKKSTGIFGAKPLGLKAFNYELKVSNDVARKLEISLNGAARAKKRLEQTRAGIKASGFAVFSQDISQPQDPVAKSVKRHNRKKQILQEINAERKKEMYLANRAERTEMRINRVLERRAKTQQKQSGMKGMMSGFSGTKVGQAVLGGGFPLLFGGGPGTVAGGAIGGLMGGFAGGIGGSLIGGMADRAVAATAKLGQAFNKFSLDVTAITKSLGVAGTATAQYLKTLEAVKGPMAAANEAQERLRSIIGDKGVADLKEFGERSQSILNSTQKFFTRMSAGLANILNWADKILGLSSGLERRELRSYAMNESNTDPQLVKLRADLEALGPNKLTRRDDKKFNDLYEKLENRAREIMTGQTQEDLANNATLQLDNQIEKLEEILKLGTREAGIQHEVAAILKEKGIIRNEDNKAQIKTIEDGVRQKTQLEEQIQLWKQIKDVIAGGLTNAIEGLISGTQTLGEALGGILKQIGQILMQKALTSMLGNISFGGGGIASGGTGAMVARDNAMYGNTFPAGSFSTGGMVTRPTVGVIGEAGEDEYIIPASKMASSMQRYSAGARGEAVIPSTGSSYAGGGGSSTTVNYSGPILNFNSEEFVPKSAVGQIIATATARGASVGESRTISSLRNSRSRRSSLGL